MPPRTNDFQRLITFLEGQLAVGATITPSAMVSPTDGGPPREIDILIEHDIGPHQVRIAIECRDHRRRQGVEWIESLVGRFQHLPVHKVIAVSRSGFTASAEALAAHANIATVTFQQALATDWPGEVARYKAGFVVWQSPLSAAEVNYSDGPKLAISGEELKAAPIEDGGGNRLGIFTDDVKYLYDTFARDDARKWARGNAKDLLAKGPGVIWPLRLSYVAHNRFLVPPHGPRRQIKEVILCLDCSYRFEEAPLQYYRYHDVLIGSAAMAAPGDTAQFSLSLLFGSDGAPRAVNLRRDPASPKDNAV